MFFSIGNKTALPTNGASLDALTQAYSSLQPYSGLIIYINGFLCLLFFINL